VGEADVRSAAGHVAGWPFNAPLSQAWRDQQPIGPAGASTTGQTAGYPSFSSTADHITVIHDQSAKNWEIHREARKNIAGDRRDRRPAIRPRPCGLGGIIAGATSAAPFAANATRHQNDTITKAMARVPGGTRVAANEVEWRHGGMILRVPTSPRASVSTSADHVSPAQSFANCSYSYSCVYSGTGWTGTEYECESSYLSGGQ
jgi:hypothetical protein